MSRHYSSSTAVGWLRNKLGIDKPYALPFGGFEKWEKQLKADRPVAYFFTETLPDLLEYPAKWTIDPINDVRYYCRNRWITKPHVIKTNLPAGRWYELETRVLHGLFNELVDFVEIDKASHMIAWGSREDKNKYSVPWWKRIQLTNWGTWRCPQAGLDHLRWEMSLDDPAKDIHERCDGQAQAARETMILYTWWKEIRSVRDDNAAYEISGWEDFHKRMDAIYGDDWGWASIGGSRKLAQAEQQEYDAIRETIDQLEKDWEQEDEDMLIRLIKLRKSLWT
jgi:hypothetical protein